MIRKIIWGLLISVFFIGFVWVVDVAARDNPNPAAIKWDDGCSRIPPDYEAPTGDSISQNNSQAPANGEEGFTVAIEESRPLRSEINRIIGRWLSPFYSKSKEIIKR